MRQLGMCWKANYGASSMAVYQIGINGVRLDSTTVSGYHTVYEGQANRTTIQLTAHRLLKAVANQEMTLTLVVIGAQKMGHLTPLTDLLTKILHLLDLPPSVYTRLVNHFP